MPGKSLTTAARLLKCGRPLLGGGLCPAWRLALVGVVILGAWFGEPALAAAQEGTPPEGEVAFCLVSVSSESRELRVGEAIHIWIWGMGVEPDTWKLTVEGEGSAALLGAQKLDSWAEFVEWTIVGGREGKVTFSASMDCRKPGDGVDSLTLTVLPADTEPIPTLTTPPSSDFCTARMTVSDPEVEVGEEFFAWFMGAGTEQRSWNLDISGEGSAKVVGVREIDPEYVEWRLEAVAAGRVRLVGEMRCLAPGDGSSPGEVVILEPGSRSDATPGAGPAEGWGRTVRIYMAGAWRMLATVEGVLMGILLVVMGVLVYLMARRPRRT